MTEKQAKYEQISSKDVAYQSTTEERNAFLAPNSHNKKTSWFLYLAAYSVTLLAFSIGTIFSWTSPVLPKLNGKVDPHLNPLPQPATPFEESWIASLIGLGALFGCLASGKCADKMGRKRTLVLASLPMILSFLMVAFGRNIYIFYAARIISGFSIGVVFAVLPMYIGEVAEVNNRGALGCMMALFVSFGILFSYAVGPFLTVNIFSITLIIPLVLFLLAFGIFIPESPVYLILKGDNNDAEKALRKLRSNTDSSIKAELQDLIRGVEESKANIGGVKDILKSKGLKKGFVITTGLLFFQQASGINIVLAFMENIFNSSRSTIPPSTAAIAVAIIQIITVIITSSLVEKLGRKVLLLISSAGSGLSIVVLGIYFRLQDVGYNTEKIFWLPVASLIGYMVFFNVGIGPLPCAILGEIFPANVKSAASVISSFTCFMFAFLITVVHPYLSVFLGTAESFWLYGTFAICCFFFVYFYVIETKGKMLSEIQDCLNGIK